MYKGLTVGVVVPAYNEEGYVGEVIDTLPGFVDRAYVVDDGSTDATWAEITRHASSRNERERNDGPFDDLVVPIRHEENRGVGGAIKTGYLRARQEELDVTAVLGGDAQMDPDELPNYLDPIAEGVADYAKGNRFVRPEDREDMPGFRLVGNVLLSYLTKIASGYWNTMDSQNGYTAISLEALQRTDIEGMYEYYGYCNDLLVRLNAADLRVADVPRSSDFAYSDGWKSHISYSEYVPRVSAMLLRGFLWRLKRKYLLTDYHPLAAFYLFGMGVMGASGLGLLTSVFGGRRRDVANWLPGLAVGVFAFLYATVLDREANRHLEVRIPAPDGDVSTTGTPADSESATQTADSEGSIERDPGGRPGSTGDGSDTAVSLED